MVLVQLEMLVGVVWGVGVRRVSSAGVSRLLGGILSRCRVFCTILLNIGVVMRLLKQNRLCGLPIMIMLISCGPEIGITLVKKSTHWSRQFFGTIPCEALAPLVMWQPGMCVCRLAFLGLAIALSTVSIRLVTIGLSMVRVCRLVPLLCRKAGGSSCLRPVSVVQDRVIRSGAVDRLQLQDRAIPLRAF